MPITLLLADDHKIVRQGLRGLLEQEADFAVIAEAEDGRDAVELAGALAPAVAIIDVRMPDMNGIDATRQLLDVCPAIKVVGLSMHADRRYVTAMLKAGARGYLLKDCAFEELVTAIRTVLAGKLYLSERINTQLIQDYVANLQRDESSAFTLLSPREREVLQLLAEGESVKAIAERLMLSVKTVETHRAQLMEKLDLHSIAELTKYAIREGLTSLGD
ncbi:MAG TPA: response regulator transcription factor [Armatimonadota bacterium]|nr:response regulator transcription factor [Armatimonadota bacterium]HOS43264.1 response regulator transcription factor [Armatimonadota bacterium]